MPKCPACEKEVYFAERKTSLGKDWHRACLRCEKCKKTLNPGSHSELVTWTAGQLGVTVGTHMTCEALVTEQSVDPTVALPKYQ
ncbi:cysteine-rich protein 1 [Plakobranchus ocellatus]|uniref:Cysteine-rich protein 1 n=1 Tax=Plakobranchus ocellatus TaxID=259542 RepID=A0AAV3ZT30_9GAST|nr:cysteine-rich protein 1 [Plakobranchus ocellatus]